MLAICLMRSCQWLSRCSSTFYGDPHSGIRTTTWCSKRRSTDMQIGWSHSTSKILAEPRSNSVWSHAHRAMRLNCWEIDDEEEQFRFEASAVVAGRGAKGC